MQYTTNPIRPKYLLTSINCLKQDFCPYYICAGNDSGGGARARGKFKCIGDAARRARRFLVALHLRPRSAPTATKPPTFALQTDWLCNARGTFMQVLIASIFSPLLKILPCFACWGRASVLQIARGVFRGRLM